MSSRGGGSARWLRVRLTAILGAVLVLASPLAAQPLADPVAVPDAGIAWAEVDREIAAALATARLRTFGKAQGRFNQMMTATSGLVESDFIPWYTSFARRKLEELQAYNHFATDTARRVFTGEDRDTGTPALIATFEHQFSTRVLKPAESREALRVLARDTVADYAAAVGAEFRRVQKQHDIPFADWTSHLATLPNGSYVGGDGRPIAVPIGLLAGPGPVWNDLTAVVAERLNDRFARLPPIADRDKLVTPDGDSIFAVGKNVSVYFGSYLLYWILLIILIQSGVIPVNLFGALIGWVIWEIFAWGTWIGFEALGFEHTRAALTTTIQAHTDAFFTQARSFIGDFGDSGPFRLFHQLERSL